MRYLVGAALLTLPAITGAQDLPACDYILEETGGTRATFSRSATGQSTTFLGGGVAITCAGQNNRLTSDSAEFYEERGVLLFVGNVKYTEPRAAIDAARMTYYQAEARVNAEGNVFVRLDNGSVMRGPVADYYRGVPGRPVPRLVATGRPELSLVETATPDGSAEPVIVLADQIVVVGDSLVYASRRVEITRTSIRANSDSAFVDSESEFVRLMQTPVVTGRGERPFTLRGGVIDLFSRERKLERVLATPSGRVVSNDLELLADSIDLRLADERLQTAYAWGPGRARATSPDRDIMADSIYVSTPGQRLREMHAVGDALANSIPDAATVTSSERDWISGDTVIARFDSAATGDTTKAVPRELVASGDARSFYQFGNPEGIRDRPTLNYVRGRVITVAFADGEVKTVTITDQASGVYLEADSLTAIPPPRESSPQQTPPRPTTPRPGTPR